MIVLDTTVLVYSVGSHHEFREPCRELITAIAGGQVPATTTVEVIQEFAHVRARRRGRIDAANLATDLTDLLGPLLRVAEQHLERGLDLWREHENLGAFDAVLAAVTLSNKATLVSVDRAFTAVPGLTHTVPDAHGVAHLLH